MLLQPYIPGLVQAIVSAYAVARKAVLPEGRRDELVRTLLSVPVGPVTTDEYLGLLERELAANGLADPEYPDDLPMASIIACGPGVLSDENLVRLALSPVAIEELALRVDLDFLVGPAADCWLEAADDLVLPPDYLSGPKTKHVVEQIRAQEGRP